MKIKSVNINIENVFKDFKIEFKNTEKKEPTIHYLVGNNGSGKTLILEAIHSGIVGIHNPSFGVCDINFELNIEEYTTAKLKYSQPARNSVDPGQIIMTDGVIANQNFRKSVYSSIEVNFSHQSIASATAQAPDEENPKSKSLNLNQLIPQLLVNIANQDGRVANSYIKNNIGTTITNGIVPGQKLPRFEKAYNAIFTSKKFHSIKENGTEFEILFKDGNNLEIPLSKLSSGEKQIIYRLGFILKDFDTIKGGIIIIDEPEISLHPKWQIHFKKLLLEIFKGTDVQIIIATHSPYIFNNIDSEKEECIFINREEGAASLVELNISGKNKSPSMGLVSYLAYGIATNELHIELYDEMQIKFKTDFISQLENIITKAPYALTKENRSKTNSTIFVTGVNNKGKNKEQSSSESKPTWIRNKLHHASFLDRKDFTEKDLQESIDEMIAILK